MLIRSLETMEDIVKNNKTLAWNGWDVIQYTPNPTAWRKSDGAFINGKWYTRKTFVLTTDGWEIPNKIVS